MNNCTIIWEKWRDPFGEDEDFDENLENFLGDSEDEYDNELESNLLNPIVNQKKIRVVATPMGIVPINEYTSSGKIFNFWVGHTNFDLTKNIGLLIESIEGVESLDIFTRYRFRIAIGKAFNDSDVMQEIQHTTYEYVNNKQ
jgi:hypothetical protein